MAVDRPDSRFGTALKATLWFAGLLVAVVAGVSAAYVLLSGVYFASRAYSRRLAPGDVKSPRG